MTAASPRALGWRAPLISLFSRAVRAVEAASVESRLGLIPPIVLAGSAGLLLVAFADTLSRLQVPNAPLLFWLGLLVLVLPATGRLLGAGATRPERIALVVLLGLGLYAVKILHSPGSFSLFDEMVHWVTLNDIVASNRLFEHNSVLPVSPYYPGLEIVTSALVRSGLSVWDAGVVVIGAARVLLSLALFLFVERAGSSARIAGVAAVIYMANPNYVFFDAQFGYESLALPLAVFVLFAVRQRERSFGQGSVATTVVIALGIGAVVVTHHITSIALAAFLVGWAACGAVLHRLRPPTAATGTRRSLGVAGPALMVIIAAVTWILYIASITVGYLGPVLTGALGQVISLVAGDESSRALFSSSGFQAPSWEQATAITAVLLLVIGLIIGAMVLSRFAFRRAAVAAAGLAALVYPLSLLGRLTAKGAELAARSTEFTFIGVGLVAAVAALAIIAQPRLRGHGRAVVLSAIAVVFVGGTILGLPFWARLPGPYLVSADPRSIEPIGIAAATWMRTAEGTANRILADRTNRNLMAAYGGQEPVTTAGDRVDLQDVYFTPELNADDLKLLRIVVAHYVEVDQRLTLSLPYVGVYLERGETELTGPWTTPLPAPDLAKWDVTQGVDRIYDNGPIQIFDVRPLVSGQQP